MKSAARMRFAHAAGLAALVAAESLVFLAATKHHYAWSYPRWNDQVQYLDQAYGAYELSLSEGFEKGAIGALTRVCPQGCLHALLALPVFALAGPSRTAALALNMAAFAAWQVATFLAVRRISGRISIAWASAGLLAALHFPWSEAAGTAVDFRLDLMAASAFGITLATALSGRGFRSTRWALLLGAAAGVTVLLRFLTAVYFGIILVALLCWLLGKPDRWSRCGRLALSALVAVGIFAPALWHNREAIYGYYWVDHFAGPVRALHDAHLGAIGSVRWLVAQVVLNQVGLVACVLGAAAAAAFALLASDSGQDGPAPEGPGPSAEGAWAITLAFLAAPAAVLAVHPIKAEPPASILIPGTVWIIFLLWAKLARRVGRAAAATVGAGVLAAGALVFVLAETRKSELDSRESDYRRINGLGDYLFFRAEEAGLAHPLVGVAWVLNGLDGDTLRVLGYERHGRLMDFAATLPTGLFPTSTESVKRALAYSDFVCLATRAAVVWPFDGQMREMLPSMREWCDGHLTYAGRIDTAEFSVSVYERPAIGTRPGGVRLDATVSSALRGAAYADPGTPAAPVFTSEPRAVASTRYAFSCRLLAAYSPVRYEMTGLPEGLTLNPMTGEIRGRFPRPGIFKAEARASNPSGSTSEMWQVHVEDSDWFSFLTSEPECSAGVPFDVAFGAFDGGGTLDFIEITDLTARKTLRRLDVPVGKGQSWSGTYKLTLGEPGTHLILMRFARYDPSAKEPYSFVDHAIPIEARPGH
jgi:hypothetical protein